VAGAEEGGAGETILHHGGRGRGQGR